LFGSPIAVPSAEFTALAVGQSKPAEEPAEEPAEGDEPAGNGSTPLGSLAVEQPAANNTIDTATIQRLPMR
jgi:hypothetical protein